MIANPERGEASLAVAGRAVVLRPSFTALVAAETELGPLFALVERAAEGRLGLAETATLFWHCAVPHGAVTREEMGEAVLGMGLAAATAPLRQLLGQILQGR
ncbi:GTA-gp10 family protein [Altererythrobacter lauratis]|uniref:GTA-gp10 family protein n=1 Tax=Alteraurantiacibacter lauratis TaxID=2054627 RepID=A0ABV7EFW4_9SPHN